MSVYRLLKVKNCINLLDNAKCINKLKNNLSNEIDVLCIKSKIVNNSIDFVNGIKVANTVLKNELNILSLNVRKSSTKVFTKLNEDLANCRHKFEESCKSLYSLSDAIEEKKSDYKKYLKSKLIKQKAEKLCQQLKKPQVYGNVVTAAGVVSLENSAATANTASATTSTASNAGSSATQIDPIPDPPPIPDHAAELLNQLNALGEPTFSSLGLGGWTPVGIVQNCMEYLHVTLGIDWWAAIVLGTLVIRICLFPLVIMSQRNAAKMNNYMPQIQALQLKMTEARQTGDAVGAARYSQEMMLYMEEKGLNPLKNMAVPLAQAPIFISFFVGLRQMANVPVESLTHGGLFWFKDLTLPDQYFILPIITSVTLWLTIELGTDGAKASSQNAVIMKYFLRSLPVIILPFTANFPGVILCYWVSSNFISLGQVAFLRLPKIRQYFNIEPMINFKPEDLPVKPKGFTEGIKESWTNMKITKELEERRRLDEIQFRRAGKGPIQKTYKYDPTTQTSPVAQAPISAKRR